VIIARQPCNGCGTLLRGEAHRCSACVRAVYCARACLETHWPAHKAACAAAAAARVGAGAGELGAEVMLQRAMEETRLEFGEEHEETLTCMRDYAFFLQQAARYEEAGALCRVALEARRRTLGDDHPATLSSIRSMANLLLYQLRFDEAEPLCREALDGSRRSLGDAHSTTLCSFTLMAVVLKAQGKASPGAPSSWNRRLGAAAKGASWASRCGAPKGASWSVRASKAQPSLSWSRPMPGLPKAASTAAGEGWGLPCQGLGRVFNQALGRSPGA
jgi:hypothetical protein